jgi:outer membrane murein-binding lipoprotein Lpp
MPDLEQRVSALEQDVSALKARVGANEEDLANIPELIRTEFRLTNSQIARLSRDVAELRDLPAKVDAMPKAVAEVMMELLADRDRKG